jgi:hypothetical protein
MVVAAGAAGMARDDGTGLSRWGLKTADGFPTPSSSSELSSAAEAERGRPVLAAGGGLPHCDDDDDDDDTAGGAVSVTAGLDDRSVLDLLAGFSGGDDGSDDGNDDKTVAGGADLVVGTGNAAGLRAGLGGLGSFRAEDGAVGFLGGKHSLR